MTKNMREAPSYVMDFSVSVIGRYIHNRYVTGEGTFYSRGELEAGSLDVFHRTDGPAIIRKTGQEEYWLDGEPYTKQDFDKIESWVFNKHY